MGLVGDKMKDDRYPIIYKMPKGWKVLLNATTAPKGTVWVTNNLPQFSGKRKYALLVTEKTTKEIMREYDCIGKERYTGKPLGKT